MKKWLSPEIECVKLDVDDIVTISDPLSSNEQGVGEDEE